MSFRYLPLKSFRNEIRLIKVRRSGNRRKASKFFNDFSLIHVSLDHSPSYFALSYVWGDSLKEWPIFVNGSLFLVTRSLGQALKRLQEEDIKYIWADALCINQLDSNEKNEQVQKMSAIYGGAIGVFAWLGPADESSKLVMGEIQDAGMALLLEGYCSYGQHVLGKKEWELLTGFAEFETRNTSPMECRKMIAHSLMSLRGLAKEPGNFNKLKQIVGWEPGISRKSFFSWMGFLNRPFWERMWIVQELVLAKQCVMICGEDRCRVEYLIAIEIFISAAITNPDPRLGLSATFWEKLLFEKMGQKGMISILVMALTNESAKYPTLSQLLSTCDRMLTTEPHDKIYGLLGIASDTPKLDIQAAYEKPLVKVCEEVMRSLLICYGIGALKFERNISFSSEYQGWPSWITIHHYFRGHNTKISVQERRPGGIFAGELLALDHSFSASGSSISKLSQCNFPDPGIFRVSGSFVGKVLKTYDITEIPLRPTEDLTAVEEALKKMDEFFDQDAKGCVELREMSKLWWLPIFHRDPETAPLSTKERYEQCSKAVFESYLAIRGQSSQSSKSIYAGLFFCCAGGRSCFLTSSGYAGISSHVKEDDRVVIFSGASVPHIVRSTQSGRYVVIGETYVLGLMHGEFMNTNLNLETIEIE